MEMTEILLLMGRGLIFGASKALGEALVKKYKRK